MFGPLVDMAREAMELLREIRDMLVELRALAYADEARKRKVEL